MRQGTIAAGLGLLLGLQAAHGAEDMAALSLETLTSLEVSGASRFTQRLTDAPSNVTLITSEDIRAFGYRTLADILRSVRGAYVTSDHIYSYAGVRGFSRPGDLNTRVLLLIDGYRYTDPVFQQSLLLGTEGLIDVDMIERVEFIPGSGSALYGSNAFFGVVNVITRKPGEFRNGMVSASAASNETYEAKVALAGRTDNGLEWLGAYSRYRSQGEDLRYPDYAATNNGVAEGLDHDKNHRAFGKLLWGPFMLELSHLKREKGLPSAPFGTLFNDPNAVFNDTVTFADLRYQDNLGDTLNLSGRLYAGDYRYEGMLPYLGVINRDTAHARWWGVEGMASWSGMKDHHLSAGFEFEKQPTRDQMNVDISPPHLYLDDHRDSSRYGLFVQDEWRFAPGWILNLGLRHDHYSEFGGTTNPRLALLHQRGVDTYKLLYGSAFRAPSAYEAYYDDDGLSQVANPDLQPETIQTWELSWERRWGVSLRTLASVYHYRIEDLITQTAIVGGLFKYQNAMAMTANGLELEAEYAWQNGMRAKASYANQLAQSDAGGVTNSPRHLLKLNLVTPLPMGLQAGAEALAMSERKTMAGHVDANAIFNLTLSGGNRQGLSWSLSACNLFDKEYSDPAGAEFVQDATPQSGRELRLKLDWRF